MDVLEQRRPAGNMAGLTLQTLKSGLIPVARAGQTLTYAELAGQLGLRPPHTIHRTALLLEDLIREQAEAGAPQLASVVISRARGGLPAPGFFMLMRDLGLYDGPDTGHDAHTFVETERTRCRDAYRTSCV